MRRLPTLLLSLALAAPTRAAAPAAPVVPDAPAARTVLVADGSGDFRVCSARMREAARGLPLDVVTFVWSHGYLMPTADLTDRENAERRGGELAAEVLRRLRAASHVSLAAHSAGAMVVLLAAARLPADSLDRVILLNPAVSVDFDVRPALRAAKYGVENFYSRGDRVGLGPAILLMGTADDPFATQAAGRYGFRQHPWDPSQRESGHDGGHYGAYAAGNLRARVFPLLLSP